MVYITTFYHRNQPNVGKYTIHGYYKGRDIASLFQKALPITTHGPSWVRWVVGAPSVLLSLFSSLIEENLCVVASWMLQIKPHFFSAGGRVRRKRAKVEEGKCLCDVTTPKSIL